jgi:predicted nucleotidyltransferase
LIFLLETLLETMHILEALKRPAALVGGLAVSAWTNPRFTNDVDLAVAVPSDDDAEQTIYQFRQRGFHVRATIEQEATGRLATVRLVPPGRTEDDVIVDLLFSSSGIEPEIVQAAQLADIGASEPIKVARPGHLVALKLLSHDPVRRPQDGMDLRALAPLIKGVDLTLAREACELIMQRGTNRGRDLRQLLALLLDSGP